MKKLFAVLLALLCLVAAAQTSSPQLEQLQRDLREQQRVRDLSNSRAKGLQNSIQSLNATERVLNARVSELNSRLTKLERERATTQKQLAQTEDKSQSLGLEIRMLEAKIAYGKQQLGILIKTLDKDRSKRYVRLLVRADNAFDLAVKARDLDAIQDVNLNVIDELNINADLLTSKNREYLGVIAKLNQYQRLLETKTAEINRNQTKLKATITDLQKTRAGQQALQLQAVRSAQSASANASSIYSSLLAEKSRLAEIRRQRAIEAERKRRAEIQRKAEEAARIARIRDEKAKAAARRLEEERQARAAVVVAKATPIFLPTNVGQFLFPLSGGGIFADFGSEGNDYMSIRGSSGAAVSAAANGTVMRVETIGSNYGYYVVIAHTEDLVSLVTMYGNLQYPNVVAGQDVRVGQIIGNVGGGALFSDNELHFHVVRSGVFVNPRPYL
jgi:septal ring factor EnvC (AmiA/AmiB activator)